MRNLNSQYVNNVLVINHVKQWQLQRNIDYVHIKWASTHCWDNDRSLALEKICKVAWLDS